MKDKSLQVLKDIFLADGARIIKIEGKESGFEHLRIYTQTDEQRDNGVVMLHRVYAEEISLSPKILLFPRSVSLVCGHGDVSVIVKSRSVKCGLCGTVTEIK